MAKPRARKIRRRAAPPPSAAMLTAPTKIARYIETRDPSHLKGVFAARGATIIENFSPHVFAGRGAVQRWTKEMRKHLDGLSGLSHEFGAPQDFIRSGNAAFFCLPTRWSGVSHGRAFSEQGGWSFVLARAGKVWRVRAYAWAVVSMTWGLPIAPPVPSLSGEAGLSKPSAKKDLSGKL